MCNILKPRAPITSNIKYYTGAGPQTVCSFDCSSLFCGIWYYYNVTRGDDRQHPSTSQSEKKKKTENNEFFCYKLLLYYNIISHPRRVVRIVARITATAVANRMGGKTHFILSSPFRILYNMIPKRWLRFFTNLPDLLYHVENDRRCKFARLKFGNKM